MKTPRQIAHDRCNCHAANGEESPYHSNTCNTLTIVVESARVDGLAALAAEIIDTRRRQAIIERARIRLGVSEATLARKMEFVTAQDTPPPEKNP